MAASAQAAQATWGLHFTHTPSRVKVGDVSACGGAGIVVDRDATPSCPICRRVVEKRRARVGMFLPAKVYYSEN